MDARIENAKELIYGFKGTTYAFGIGVLDRVGPLTAQVGKRALLVRTINSAWLFFWY